MRLPSFAALFLASVCLAPAQSPTPKFEVVSVKAVQSPMEMMRAGKMPGGLVFSGSRVDVGSMALKNLIATAYRTEISKISVPEWTAQAFFSLQAVMPEGATKEQYPDMLRTMLEERFHLVSHKETKDQAAYLLTAAKGGHKMKPARELDQAGCETWRDAPPNAGGKTCNFAIETDGGKTNVTLRTDSAYGPSRSSISHTTLEMELYSVTMPKLAEYLTSVIMGARAEVVYTPVFDKTGLDGKWDVVVERVFEDVALSAPGGPTSPIPITPALIANELMRGLTRMGLKLEKTTAPVEILVVDKLDKTPTEN